MIITASAAIIQENKILLVKRIASALLFPGYWAFPGGKSEPGETSEQIAIREVKEETNLDFVPSEMFMKAFYQDRTMHRFIGSWSGEIIIQEDELSDYNWFSYNETHVLDLAFDYREVIAVLHKKGLIQ